MAIKTYKGTDKDMKCRGFQFEVGKEYEAEGDINACSNGFHACEMPLDVLKYYEPGKGSRYFEAEQDGDISRDSDDSKIASRKIKVGAEIGIPGLVKAQIEYVTERTTKNTKGHSKAVRSANSATGDGSANSATGSRSANSATGYGSANISTGENCENNGAGERNISVAWGRESKCKGAVGCFLVLSEWGEWDGGKYPFCGAVMVEVDGETIKPDTWYMLRNGEICEVT